MIDSKRPMFPVIYTIAFVLFAILLLSVVSDELLFDQERPVRIAVKVAMALVLATAYVLFLRRYKQA